MAGNGINEKSRMSVPLFMALTVVVSAITGTAAAVASAFGFKETALERIEQRIQQESARINNQRSEALSHYLTLERFGDWRQQERVRSDQQYYGLLNAIDRLRQTIETRHR
jgi:cobyrinic acid a,c-diamide synthase